MSTYQTFAAPISDTLAHFQAWAQFFGGGFTTIGWQSMFGSGTVNTSGTAVTWVSGTTFISNWAGSSIIINGTNFTIQTVNSSTSITLTASAGTNTGVAYTAGFGNLPATGTGASYAFTNPVLPTAAITACVQYTYRGQWVSGQTYPNGNNSNGTADIVTDNSSGGNGISYVKITTNVATNLTVAPHSNATDWLPIQFEIWKSTGANSSTFPLFVKLVYTTAGAANNTIRYFLSIGTGVDLNGNLTGTAPLSLNTPTNVAVIDNTTTTSSTLGEMDFAGDADNCRWITWRGHTTTNFIMCTVVDRSINASGVYTNAFAYIGTMNCIGGGNILRSSILTNPSIGTGPVSVTAGTGWLGLVWGTNSATSFTLFGANPPLPIFPLLGFIQSPLMGAVGFHRPDVTDGAVYPVWTYGGTHYYLVSSSSSAALQTIDNQGANGVVVAILWE